MASVIEDAETYQQSSPMVTNDLVPLTNPSSDLAALRSSVGNVARGSKCFFISFLVLL